MSKRVGRPPHKSWPTCKVEGCENTTKGSAFGVCRAHYMQIRRGMRSEDGELLRQPQRVRSYGVGARCVVEGCLSRPKARGLCNKHHLQYRAGQLDINLPTAGHKQSAEEYWRTKCKMHGCDTRAVNRGMCSKHAQQRMAGIIDVDGEQLRELMKAGRRPMVGPILDGSGYTLVVAPEHYQGITRDGRMLEHRLLIEQNLGRLLHPREVVHHINGVKTDNRLENLEVRTRKTHPPGAEATAERLQQDLEHLKHNDPAAYEELLRGL